MNDRLGLRPPKSLARLLSASRALGFSQGSDLLTGALLRVLAASKPSGRFLELGTGTGVGTAWLLDGMDDGSHLLSVDRDPAVSAVARKYLGNDRRVAFRTADAKAVIDGLPKGRFDLIFADAWAGKFTHRRAALALLKAGGIYVVDDMIRQPALPRSHEKKIRSVIRALVIDRALAVTQLQWSSGIVIATKRGVDDEEKEHQARGKEGEPQAGARSRGRQRQSREDQGRRQKDVQSATGPVLSGRRGPLGTFQRKRTHRWQ